MHNKSTRLSPKEVKELKSKLRNGDAGYIAEHAGMSVRMAHDTLCGLRYNARILKVAYLLVAKRQEFENEARQLLNS